MLLTVSKRLEFSASRRLFSPALSEAENRAAFGSESAARYGTGRNYVAYFVFTGEVNAINGMLVNISEIKRRVEEVLHACFDHKFLNEDHPGFRDQLPTTEKVARQLFTDVEPLFGDLEAALVACHLVETPARSATVYAGGVVEANDWFEFSAARQTMSPHLSAAENNALFGTAASPHGHGHHYRARFTLREEARPAEVVRCLDSLRADLDHKNLNHAVPGLTNRPKTNDSLERHRHERAATAPRRQRVRIPEGGHVMPESWAGRA